MNSLHRHLGILGFLAHMPAVRRMGLVALCLLFFVLAVAAQAQTTPTYGEKFVGNTSCTNGASGTDFDTLIQCTSTTSSTGTMQKAPLFVGAVTSPPYASVDCDSNKAGMIQWTGTDLQFCDGTTWNSLTGGGGGATDPGVGAPDNFDFTNVTGQPSSTTIFSNTVSLTGTFTNVTATCTGCTQIARNSVWKVGTTATGYFPGDTIALALLSSSLSAATTSAYVTMGGRMSGIWQVTTASPTAFSFTDQTGVQTSISVYSNAVTLAATATFTNAVATCVGCTQIMRNGVWTVGTTATGFNVGDTIAIVRTSPETFAASATARVTVGSTQSGIWTITTATSTGAIGVVGGFTFAPQTDVVGNTTIYSNVLALTGRSPM